MTNLGIDPQTTIYIRDGRYLIVLPDGSTCACDRYGSTYKWTPEPDEVPGFGVVRGRRIRSVAELPAAVVSVVQTKQHEALKAIA